MSDFEAESYYWSLFDRFELLIPGWMILEAWYTRQVPDHFADLVRRPDRCTKQAIAEELAAYAEDVDPEEEADNWKYIVKEGILYAADREAADILYEPELPELPAGIEPPFMTNVPSKRGAPMGRSNSTTCVPPADQALFLVRVPFQGDAYDPGGAYWGLPSNLWCVFSPESATKGGPFEQTVIYLRATYPEEAVELVKKEHNLPNDIVQHVWRLDNQA
jgi:hypothetical protein